MNSSSHTDASPSSVVDYTETELRARLWNIRACESSIGERGRRDLIDTYLPGQASYQLGEYPSAAPYDPDEADAEELARLAGMGVQVLQVMEDWNDILRLHGADKFTSPNPAGLQRFIDMAHEQGIKVLLYLSSGYMQYGDPDFRPEWSREPPAALSLHWRLMRCSPSSPGWRRFHMNQLTKLLDEWGIDGIYDDWGHHPARRRPTYAPTSEEVIAWPDRYDNDAAKVDQLAIQYEEVHRRGGIVKMHSDRNLAPEGDYKTYDYLWVGENVGDLTRMIKETRWHPPHVVPVFDARLGHYDSEEKKFAYSIPYAQFPQVFGGRPLTGQRAAIPGVEYSEPTPGSLVANLREYWQRYQAGEITALPIYSAWELGQDPIPGARELWAEWLRHYRLMTEPGTMAYLEITKSSFLVDNALPADCVLSAFANRELHLAIANHGDTAQRLRFNIDLVDIRDEAARQTRVFELPAHRLLVLRWVGPDAGTALAARFDD